MHARTCTGCIECSSRTAYLHCPSQTPDVLHPAYFVIIPSHKSLSHHTNPTGLFKQPLSTMMLWKHIPAMEAETILYYYPRQQGLDAGKQSP